MIELTQRQWEQLGASVEKPPTIVDPATNSAYVLLRRDDYERICAQTGEDDARLMEPLLADLDSEDWEDASAYEAKP